MKAYVRGVLNRVAADVREYGVAAAAFALYVPVSNLLFGAVCPLVAFCGIPCPGCGASRAAFCLLTGRWRQAWQYQPMIFPIALAALYFGWNRYLQNRKARGMTAVAAALAAGLVLVYGVRMYLYFPDREPCVYMADNLLARIAACGRRF